MIIAVDFDGVIAKYDGFCGKRVFGKPIDGVRDGLASLRANGHTILINTTRLEVDEVSKYLDKNKLPYDHINYCPLNNERFLHPAKQCADIYLDDRAICFKGDWEQTVQDVEDFKPWWKKDGK